MNESKTNNQPPIFRFLAKHKWRIILPLIFALFYFALPRYLAESIAVQQNLFIKSPTLNQEELKRETNAISNSVKSDEFLGHLINKYDLFKTKRKEGFSEKEIIQYWRERLELRLEDENMVEGVGVFNWLHFRDRENFPHIAAISDDIFAKFEQNQNLRLNRYVSKPYDAIGHRKEGFLGGMLQGLVMIVIPLIFIWEIPNIFYSPKTKKMVFEPLLADWQEELTDAKLRGESWRALQINIRYSFAYLAVMIQKSPLGDLFDFFGKFAK
jgi:hypothetical protein